MSEYKVDVKIDGKTYTLVSKEPKENIKDIAEIFDRKIQEVKSNRLTFDRQLVLAGVNITDDLYRLAEKYKSLKEESEVPLREYPKLKEEVDLIRSEKDKLLRESLEDKERLDELDKDNSKLKRDLVRYKDSKETIDKLKNEVKRLQVEVMDLSKENDSLKGKL